MKKCFLILLLGIWMGQSRADVVVSMLRAGADSVVVFKFKKKSNVFMPGMFGNEKGMGQLKKWTDAYRTEIDRGTCRFSMESFCDDSGDEKTDTEMARLRSIYVKGYLIQTLRLKEKNFVTRNLPIDSYYQVKEGGIALKKEKALEKKIPVAEVQNLFSHRDTIIIRDTVIKEIIRREVIESEPEIREIVKEVKEISLNYRSLRIKTNTLDWLLLTPNAEMEYLFNERWGVNVDVRWSCWNWNNDAKTYRLALGSPEIRYYFAGNSVLRGAFAGLYYQGGKFNYKLDITGYQGSVQGGGVVFGYIKPLCGRMFAEFSAGVGLQHLKYNTYIHDGEEDIETGSDNSNRWRITKAKVTLGWRLWKK